MNSSIYSHLKNIECHNFLTIKFWKYNDCKSAGCGSYLQDTWDSLEAAQEECDRVNMRQEKSQHQSGYRSELTASVDNCGGVTQSASGNWKLCGFNKPKATRIEYLQNGIRKCLTVKPTGKRAPPADSETCSNNWLFSTTSTVLFDGDLLGITNLMANNRYGQGNNNDAEVPYLKYTGNEGYFQYRGAELPQYAPDSYRYSTVSAEDCADPGHPDEIYQLWQNPEIERSCAMSHFGPTKNTDAQNPPDRNEIVWAGNDAYCLASCGRSASGKSFCSEICGGAIGAPCLIVDNQIFVVPCGTQITGQAVVQNHWTRRRTTFYRERLSYNVLSTQWASKPITVSPPTGKRADVSDYLFREVIWAPWTNIEAQVLLRGASSYSNTGPNRYPCPQSTKNPELPLLNEDCYLKNAPTTVLKNNPTGEGIQYLTFTATTYDTPHGEVHLWGVQFRRENADRTNTLSTPHLQAFKRTGEWLRAQHAL